MCIGCVMIQWEAVNKMRWIPVHSRVMLAMGNVRERGKGQ